MKKFNLFNMIDKEEAFLELLSNKRKRIDENIVYWGGLNTSYSFILEII